MTSQALPAYALNEIGRVDNPDGTANINLRWNLPTTILQANQMFLDVSPDPGFTSYYSQLSLSVSGNITLQTLVNLPGGIYYARINIHYPGYTVGGVDRGWAPSNVIPIVVPGGPPPPTGLPATALHQSGTTFSWTLGQPLAGSTITLMAFDMSIQPDFGDILSAPFISPSNGAVNFDRLPFSVDLPTSFTHLTVNLIPPALEYYWRINTQFSQRTWLPSEVVHVKAGQVQGISPLLLAGAVGLGILGVAAYEQSKNGGGEGGITAMFRSR